MADTSLQAITNYVQAFVNIDDSDIPVDLMNAFVQQGFDDLIGTDIRWPFYEVGDATTPCQIVTVQGTQQYAIPAPTIQGLQPNMDPHRIVAVQGLHWELQYSSQTAMESEFPPAFVVQGEPERYSYWGADGITIWPIPNDAWTLSLRAYRDPIDWISLGSGGLMDAPNDFFGTLQAYVLGMAWAQQEDLQQASFWNQQYQAGKTRLVRKYLRAPLPEGIVVNGGVPKNLPPGLRFPFESAFDLGQRG